MAEIEALVNAPDLAHPLAWRDRALLELLYGEQADRLELGMLDRQGQDEHVGLHGLQHDRRSGGSNTWNTSEARAQQLSEMFGIARARRSYPSTRACV